MLHKAREQCSWGEDTQWRIHKSQEHKVSKKRHGWINERSKDSKEEEGTPLLFSFAVYCWDKLVPTHEWVVITATLNPSLGSSTLNFRECLEAGASQRWFRCKTPHSFSDQNCLFGKLSFSWMCTPLSRPFLSNVLSQTPNLLCNYMALVHL